MVLKTEPGPDGNRPKGIRRDHHRYSKRVTRTKRWQALRAEILERDRYRCKSCGCGGRLEVDHIKPVRTHPDLSYDPGNLQALCPSCHTRKTRIECGHKPARQDLRAWSQAVRYLEKPVTAERWSIPYGLTSSRVRVNIVCGPPAAGKTTYVREHAGPDDTVVDFDECLRAVGGQIWETDRSKVRAAFKLRDDAIREFSDQRRGHAWLIISAPSVDERREWQRQLRRASIVVLDVAPDTCKARIRADPDRQHAVDEMCSAVDKWWMTYAADRGATHSSKWS